MKNLKLIILCGGLSNEREVSITSGRAIEKALQSSMALELVELVKDEFPDFINPQKHIVFPAMHGTFGEDGQLQKLMEERGVYFVGSGSDASKLCMDKIETKAHLKDIRISFAEQIVFEDPNQVNVDFVVNQLGEDVFLKRVNFGSSFDVCHLKTQSELHETLSKLPIGQWMIEKRVKGKEITVGVLGSRAQIPIEVVPKQNTFYDYKEKYTKGISEYKLPPELDPELLNDIREKSVQIFNKCGCRDLARLDYMLTADNELFFIEINTIPGFTPNSLVPKAAKYEGVEFSEICKSLVDMALKRFHKGVKAAYV